MALSVHTMDFKSLFESFSEFQECVKTSAIKYWKSKISKCLTGNGFLSCSQTMVERTADSSLRSEDFRLCFQTMTFNGEVQQSIWCLFNVTSDNGLWKCAANSLRCGYKLWISRMFSCFSSVVTLLFSYADNGVFCSQTMFDNKIPGSQFWVWVI